MEGWVQWLLRNVAPEEGTQRVLGECHDLVMESLSPSASSSCKKDSNLRRRPKPKPDLNHPQSAKPAQILQTQRQTPN